MNNDFESEKDEMIARANEAVEKVAVEFVGDLKDRISALEKAILMNNPEDVVSMAYDLETEAATFGWPRVTRICKWLRVVFSAEYDQKPEAELILKVISSLKLMVSDPENPNEARDMALFKELFPDMVRVVPDI